MAAAALRKRSCAWALWTRAHLPTSAPERSTQLGGSRLTGSSAVDLMRSAGTSVCLKRPAPGCGRQQRGCLRLPSACRLRYTSQQHIATVAVQVPCSETRPRRWDPVGSEGDQLLERMLARSHGWIPPEPAVRPATGHGMPASWCKPPTAARAAAGACIASSSGWHALACRQLSARSPSSSSPNVPPRQHETGLLRHLLCCMWQ